VVDRGRVAKADAHVGGVVATGRDGRGTQCGEITSHKPDVSRPCGSRACDRDVDVVANYTAFYALHQRLRRRSDLLGRARLSAPGA